MKIRLTEQEKNRILNIHQTSKNVNGELIVEAETGTLYVIQLTDHMFPPFDDEETLLFQRAVKGGLKFKEMRKKCIQSNMCKYYMGPYRTLEKAESVLAIAKKYFTAKGGPVVYVEDPKGDYKVKEVEVESYPYIYRICTDGSMKFNNQKCKGEKKNVATETDTENLKFPNLELSDTLTLSQMPTFDPTKEGIVYKCDKDLGCAAYVRQELGEYQGNAWHAHRHNDPLVYSAFLTGMGKKKNEIEQLFNKINKSPGTLSSKQDSFDNEARNIAKSFVPNQSRFSSLEIDDVVGLYYDKSDMHSSAFFEGMTGYDDNGTGTKLGDGPFMVKKDGTEWRPKDLGQNVEFQIGKTLTGGKGPGLNTHLGYVGAKNNGEPIIFHNVYGNVYATPLKELSKDGTAIVWAKRGKGTSGEKVVANQKYDEIEQKAVGYFDYLYKKYIGN